MFINHFNNVLERWSGKNDRKCKNIRVIIDPSIVEKSKIFICWMSSFVVKTWIQLVQSNSFSNV